MVVKINDKETKLEGDSPSIQDVIDKAKHNTSLYVVYLNEKYISRLRHHKTNVSAGDRITIYPLVSGG